MTSEKTVDNAQRIDALVARIAALEGDSSWTDTGGMTGTWSKASGYFKYKFIGKGIVMVAAQNLIPGTVADGTTILTAANGLAAAYRPAGPKQLPCTSNFIKTAPVGSGSFEGSWFEFEAGGSVQCFGFGTAATFANCFGIFTTDL